MTMNESQIEQMQGDSATYKWYGVGVGAPVDNRCAQCGITHADYCMGACEVPKGHVCHGNSGLRDRKGNEIFVGDKCTVKMSNGSTENAFVAFVDGCFELHFIRPVSIAGFYNDRDYLKCHTCNYAVEVITSDDNRLEKNTDVAASLINFLESQKARIDTLDFICEERFNEIAGLEAENAELRAQVPKVVRPVPMLDSGYWGKCKCGEFVHKTDVACTGCGAHLDFSEEYNA